MTQRLRETDRELFSLVSEAAFENPFGERRSHLDAAISGGAADDPQWGERMLSKVGARLQALSAHGRLGLAEYGDSDRELVENTLLFETFHRYLEPLDRLIAGQEQAAAAPLRVSFATEFMHGLAAHGLSAERALRMFELFYQMRRAHYFIARSLTGPSACMRELREQLWQAVFTRDIARYERHLWNRMEDFSTILLGETGTGKGAAAAAIGRSGFIPFDAKTHTFAHGFAESFVPINLNEFPETLFESEIFGHRKGAFTGAVDHYEGALARCPAYGSVFFDEIGEATLPVQVKLLRVLQERQYAPVGGREPRRFTGRILAATHRSLDELRASGAMRDDFFYRLSSNVIELPPLRLRIAQSKSELPTLVTHLCARISGGASDALAREVSAAIVRDLGSDYAFPGNVRELEQCVRRVLMTGSCAPDRSEARGKSGTSGASLSHALETLDKSQLSAEALLDQYCAQLYARTRSYVEVAERTGLDRRTVKKRVEQAHKLAPAADGGVV